MADIAAEAQSLAQMVTEWVDGGLSMGTDWRPGLEAVIAARLQRLRSPSDKEPHSSGCECYDCWQAMEIGTAV
jgi:hypothetical protein